MVLTFKHADDAASFLTICWNVAMCTGLQVKLTAHMHGIEWSAKVFWHDNEQRETELLRNLTGEKLHAKTELLRNLTGEKLHALDDARLRAVRDQLEGFHERARESCWMHAQLPAPV